MLEGKEDGIQVMYKCETIWATQKAISQLFDVGVPAISKHLKNIFESGELVEDSVISKMETTASDGKNYNTTYYNLDAIISVGYRVTPHTDTGDYVIVINADKVQLTGNKAAKKSYWRYSGWLGGLKTESFEEAMAKHPERVIEHAVKGMLPKTTLGRQQFGKLKVYAGPEHPHAAQNPVKIELEG